MTMALRLTLVSWRWVICTLSEPPAKTHLTNYNSPRLAVLTLPSTVYNDRHKNTELCKSDKILSAVKNG